jgi:hypothetical protein
MIGFRIVSVLCFALLILPRSEGQVTANVFERVLNVRVNAGTPKEKAATAFTIDVDGREYLITAKHVVSDLKERDKIEIFINGGWSPLNVQIFPCDDPIDIAVLIPPHQMTVNFELSADATSVFVGQQAYFLGFPYGIQIPSYGATGPYPLAMVKGGIISAVLHIGGPSSNTAMILLDGYNNPGFSGGPIVYKDLDQPGLAPLKLAGVISGFEPEVVPVMKERDIKSPSDAGEDAKAQPWKIRRRANGTYFEYLDAGTFVALNTGIVTGYMMQPALDLIRKHPIGPTVKDLPNNQPEQ